MIPEQQTQNTVVDTIVGEERAFSIKSISNIFELLRKSMYNDKPTAVAREIISNAIDANLESGSTKKVLIKFPTKLNPTFSVQDFGIGIDKERMLCVTAFGDSTKINTNKQIGGFGLGIKSPWSISDQFTITTVTGGIKYKYLCYLDAAGCGIAKELFAIPTDEASGTTIDIPVTDNDHIERIKKQARLFMLCNPDKIEFDGCHDFNIYETIQHKVSLRGFFPSNYHVFDWSSHGVHNCIIVLNGYVPYIIEQICNNTFNLDAPYTYLIKYDIGVLDIPATRESISDTPKNNKIVFKIKPTIRRGINNLRNFLIERKEKNEEIGAITYTHTALKLPSEYINRKAIHSTYRYSDFYGCISRNNDRYYTPSSPSTTLTTNQIIVEIDDSKKYNVSYSNYAEHIMQINPSIVDVCFVHRNMLSDRTKKIFKVVPLHGFSPTPVKKQVVKKTKEEKQEESLSDGERVFYVINLNDYKKLDEIQKEPENFRKVECERNQLIDSSLDKHINNLRTDRCSCKYGVIRVNKTEMKFFKQIKSLSVDDITLSTLIYKQLISAYMLKYLSILLKKQRIYSDNMLTVIIDFLQRNKVIPYNNPFLNTCSYARPRLNKREIADKTSIYKVDNNLLKKYKKIAYSCGKQLINMLNDPRYAYTLSRYSIYRDELLEEYSNNVLDIFHEYKEMFK